MRSSDSCDGRGGFLEEFGAVTLLTLDGGTALLSGAFDKIKPFQPSPVRRPRFFDSRAPASC